MSKSTKTQFIIFWRLTTEKGLWLLTSTLERLIHEQKQLKNNILDQSNFLIFGDWEYRKKILTLATQSQSIKYFGRKPLTELQRYVWASDYTLMPSMFLETFGLTALESLSLWVPVVWFKKWGVVPFIQHWLNIEEYQGKSPEEKLYNCIIHLISTKKLEKQQEQCELASKTSHKYIPEHRIKNFHKVIHTDNSQKKILLVSDYKTVLYGIETHIHWLKNILSKDGYSIDIFGANIKKNKLSQLVRILMLPFTTFNFWAAWKLHKHIKKNNPDIIRRHSTSRRLGWFPMWVNRNFHGKQWVTYHDLWYFHPFPSKVYEESQIPKRDLKSYLKATRSNNPIILAAAICKFVLISKLRIQLKNNIDKHFVPSRFLLPITQRRLWHKPKGKVMLLEHFLRNQ